MMAFNMTKKKLGEFKNSTVESEYFKKDSVENKKFKSLWTRSCEQEIVEPIQGVVSGEIPAWINGSLLRNGPGSIKVGDSTFNHLFDAAALLHRFNIADGNVTYQCRFLKSETYKRNRAANQIVMNEFATCAIPDPCESIFKRLSSVFTKAHSDNALISIYPINDEFYAFTEFPIIYKFDPESLETLNKVDLSQRFLSHSAHPIPMSDGSTLNLAVGLSNGRPFYKVVRFTAGGNIVEDSQVIAKIAPRWNFNISYMHTFGVTENFFVIVEQPYTISLTSIIKAKMFRKPFVSCFNWDPTQPVVFQLVDRQTGEVAHKFQSKAFCYFHIINQYETNESVVVDICCFEDASVVDKMYIESLEQQPTETASNIYFAKPMRFILPLKNNLGSEVEPELICDIECELPMINSSVTGKDYQFFYAVASEEENCLTLTKVDVKSRTKLTWSEFNCYPSEPIFIPSPDSSSEDDGVIVASLVWGQGDENRVGLLVLDAKTMAELGRCEFNDLPSPVPRCFHGCFASKNK